MTSQRNGLPNRSEAVTRARWCVYNASICMPSPSGMFTTAPAAGAPSASSGPPVASSKISPPKRYPANGMTSNDCALAIAAQVSNTVTAMAPAERDPRNEKVDIPRSGEPVLSAHQLVLFHLLDGGADQILYE